MPIKIGTRYVLTALMMSSLAALGSGCVTDDDDVTDLDEAPADEARVALEQGPDELVADELTGAPWSAAFNQVKCVENAVKCAKNVITTQLACTAAILSEFSNFKADAKCVQKLSTGAEACANTNTYCNFGTITNTTEPGAFVGSSQGYSRTETWTCGNVTNGSSIDRVRRGFFWVKNGVYPGSDVVSKMKFVCTNGAVMTFGTNNGDQGELSGNTCNTGHLIQGLETYAGDAIDKIRVRCDNVTDTTSSDVTGVWRGGAGGDPENSLCSEGKYMFGASVYYRNTSKGEVIAGLSILCRY